MDDKYFDALLNVKTGGGQKGFSSSVHNNRYEPTPYAGLDSLFNHYQLKKTDRVVDFGCGKGRILFYIHHFFKATVIGVEVDKGLYHDAVQNRNRYVKKPGILKEDIEIHHCAAQEYEINPFDNHFYFFNPFSIQVFKHTVSNILQSNERNPRGMEIILYYGSTDYTRFLEDNTSFQLKKEIIIPELFAKNTYERFMVYRLG
ncbi:class I SAM-dependent methyltransferase [Bacillus sp. REN16]|uniref:class I SAM-dependent methyltransferase n=1 Tax=Bacillus sp. REN16 TaxID=2887296 RepID=UPI001E3CEFEC|nr:class I SAM-dependent methyltransferase [Bacillus sp. REN16]MCC3358800.1 class I SAM-dependent methyltransferase [Bacillus sp. REN16]